MSKSEFIDLENPSWDEAGGVAPSPSPASQRHLRAGAAEFKNGVVHHLKKVPIHLGLVCQHPLGRGRSHFTGGTTEAELGLSSLKSWVSFGFLKSTPTSQESRQRDALTPTLGWLMLRLFNDDVCNGLYIVFIVVRCFGCFRNEAGYAVFT